MHTQQTSKARVKNDTIGDDKMVYINKAFMKSDLDEFRKVCIDAIQESSGKPATKLRFTDELNRAPNKAKMLFTVTNYFLAGQGLGV